MSIIRNNLQNKGSQKRAYKQLNTNKTWIPTLKSKVPSINVAQSRSDIVDIASDFFKNLYKCQESIQYISGSPQKNYFPHSRSQIPLNPTLQMPIPVRPFEEREILKQIDKLKVEKCPGPDGIPNEALKVGKFILITPITLLFNKILQEQKTPKCWCESRIILLYKKGTQQM